jgi:beta-glucanase (GH16 family)
MVARAFTGIRMLLLACLPALVSGWPAAQAQPAVRSFDDEFDTFTPGAKWDWIATNSPQGRGGPKWGELGNQWWTNPQNSNTPIRGLYFASDGMLHLGLRTTPPRYQAYIDSHAGKHLPYVGALLNNQHHALQRYGIYTIKVAVDRVPGVAFLSDIEAHPIGPWPPEIDLLIYTDADNVQWVKFAIHISNADSTVYKMSSKDGFDPSTQHIYSWDWAHDHITFFVDGAQQFRTATPSGSSYHNHPVFMYLATYANYTGPGSTSRGNDPDPTRLPAYAHIDYVRVDRTSALLRVPPDRRSPDNGGTG